MPEQYSMSRSSVVIKSALKGTHTVREVEMIRPTRIANLETVETMEDDFYTNNQPIIASDVDSSDEEYGQQLPRGTMAVDECKALDPDLFVVTKRKSRHKVRHDIYDLHRKIFKLMDGHGNNGVYPSPETMLRISRLAQHEHVTNHLASIKVQQASSSVVATGHKGGQYRINSKGKKVYL